MAKAIFAGRKNYKRDFSDYLVRMTVDTKGVRHLLSFRKKKDEDEIYPRIMLLYGAAGSGKSAMVRQYIDFARGIGSELKKPLKVVSVDCEEILTKNVMMLRTLIQSIYTTFTHEEIGSAGCFSEYAQIERRIIYIHEKVEQLCKHEWVGETVFAVDADSAPSRGGSSAEAEVASPPDSPDADRRANEDAQKLKAFTNWLRASGKLLDDELDIYENSDYRLSKALVNGIVQLSLQYPVILAIDAFDRVSNPEIEEWMRKTFMAKLFERKNNILIILSGRADMVRSYRNEFAEELLDTINFDDFPLTRSNIADCARMYQAQLADEQVRRIEEATGGVPFVVRNVLGLVKDKAPLESLLDASGKTAVSGERAILSEVKRFLGFCPDETVKKRVVQCACMRRLENTILSKLWNVAYADIGPLIAEYATRYPFIVDDEAPERGNALLREYCIKEAATGADQGIVSVLREFGSASAPLFYDLITQLSTAITLVEKRYEDERYQEAILAYCNSLLWYDRDHLFQVLPGILLECLHYNSTFAVRLLQCIDEFRAALSPEQIRVADIYISGILSGHPMDIWLETIPGEEEKAMIGIFEENAAACNEGQRALLNCRRGEMSYRRKDYERAFELFKLCLPYVNDSEVFKKDIIDDLFALGNKLFAAEKHETVVEVFRHVTELKPGEHEAWYMMGRAQTKLGRIADSTLSYVKTVELKPGIHDAWHQLGKAYFGVGSFENSVQAFTQALGMKQDDAEGWFTLGKAYAKLGRYEEAIHAMGKASDQEPGDKNIWMEFGAANASTGRYEKAEACYEKAVLLDQRLHEAWFGLGKAQFRLGQYKKAVETLGTALNLVHDNKEYIYNMAMACHAAGDYDAAIRNWGNFIEIEPSDSQAKYRMGLSLHARGQYSDAIQFYLKAAEGLPENIEVWHNMGRAYHAQGLHNDAVEKYRKSLQIDPARPEIWDDLGLVFTEMNLYGDAIQAYNELVRLAPSWKEAWYHLGHTYYSIRHYENAAKSYGKVVEIDPDYHYAWGSLGLTYYALGNYEKAIEAGAKALSLKPDELWIQSNVALSTLLMGNLPQASIEYDKVIALSKTGDDLAQPIAALEGVLSRGTLGDSGKDILEKLKKGIPGKATPPSQDA